MLCILHPRKICSLRYVSIVRTIMASMAKRNLNAISGEPENFALVPTRGKGMPVRTRERPAICPLPRVGTRKNFF